MSDNATTTVTAAAVDNSPPTLAPDVVGPLGVNAEIDLTSDAPSSSLQEATAAAAANSDHPSPTENDHRTHRTEEIPVDLSGDRTINVDISDALSERDKVKYTVRTRTQLREMKPESSVVREHDEFIWLHNEFAQNENYAGFIIPPPPPRPDFEASREKLQRLGEGEATMTREEFAKMKHDLEQDYLAQFKKTVAMHEVFLCRLAAHPVFCQDENFRIFLQYENDLSVRGKNRKELVESFWKRFTQSADEVLLSGQRDVDEFFEHERTHLVEYHTHVRDACAKADRVTRLRKNVAETYAKCGDSVERSTRNESDRDAQRVAAKSADTFAKLRKAAMRAATDHELKLGDTLRYFSSETAAAKELLYRRLRCLANYEAANKNLERARARAKDVPKAEAEQQVASRKFEDISTLARTELKELKKRRVAAFAKNLADYVDLEIKHAKTELLLLRGAIASLKGEY